MRFDGIHLRPYRQVEFTSIFDDMARFETEQPKFRSGDDSVLLAEHGHRLRNRLRDRLKSKNADGKIGI
ncbi:hypothetical protein SAMN04515617_10140 [Collimonas sp. OK242]|jgi:hypothetical protein|uniref:hypothetical protein n=1 Tax=Collimonas sp. OK242 TaxID=1798195 RepID=UPI00089AA10F|nr:hypothetical protein [Collimonas sp. OK242]SDX06499.1 hypothetical protein SAMN04515617_10140 [Collimonas sp. OK242]